MKAMDLNWMSNDSKVACVIGVVCGLFKLLDIYLLTDAYVVVLLKVFVTAVVGGVGGVAGKHLFSYLKTKYLKFKNKKP